MDYFRLNKLIIKDILFSIQVRILVLLFSDYVILL